MHFERYDKAQLHTGPPQLHATQSTPSATAKTIKNLEDQPLACMFYFFHSQMLKHTSTPPDPDLVRRKLQNPGRPVHRFDTHLSRLQMAATFDPAIKSCEVIPVAVDGDHAVMQGQTLFNRVKRQMQEAGSRGEERVADTAHDTVLFIEFRSKAARQSWMAGRDWERFYDGVNAERVFRHMPHVRCARSFRGLMDVTDVLTA